MVPSDNRAGTENGGLGGAIAFDVQLVDKSHNLTVRHQAGVLRLDFAPPVLAAAAVSPPVARLGAQIQLFFTASEPLAGDAVVTSSMPLDDGAGGKRSTFSLQPDGVILTPPQSEHARITALLEESGIEFARIGSLQPGPGLALAMDDEHAAGLATDHLARLGHRRIGFIAGSSEYSLSARRTAGWKAAMDARGLPTANLLAEGNFSYESGLVEARALLDLDAPPTAIIASSDRMTLACLDVAAERNLAVPGDLSLLSFDNTPVVHFTKPTLTAIDQPVAAIAATAMELIIRSLRDDVLPPQPVIIEASLVERQSTAPPRDV